VHGVAQEQERARHHEDNDGQRGERVAVLAAGGDHQQGGDDRRDGANGVAEHVEEGTAGGEACVLRPHDQGGGVGAQQPDHGRDEHRCAAQVRGLA